MQAKVWIRNSGAGLPFLRAAGGGNPAAARLAGLIQDTSGAALVEFTVLAPILMLMWVGAMEFGPLLKDKLILQDAVHQGAQAMAAGGTDPNVYADTLSQVSAAAGAMSASLTVSLSICNASATSCSACGASGASSCATLLPTSAGDAVEVTATYPCSLTYKLFNLGPTCTLSASESALIE